MSAAHDLQHLPNDRGQRRLRRRGRLAATENPRPEEVMNQGSG
jgi:hypothetical protein